MVQVRVNKLMSLTSGSDSVWSGARGESGILSAMQAVEYAASAAAVVASFTKADHNPVGTFLRTRVLPGPLRQRC